MCGLWLFLFFAASAASATIVTAGASACDAATATEADLQSFEGCQVSNLRFCDRRQVCYQ